MHPRKQGLPPRPSVPLPPHTHSTSQYSVQPVASSSSASTQSSHYWNAYAQYAQPQYGVASHYAQAYAQQGWGNHATSEGYTLSSTYNPGQAASTSFHIPRLPSRPNGQWYQPGTSRCSKPGCQFTGAQKSVEIHMMDRHLIYPPGWEKRKKKDDWDADPSLKGKPIPILGTNLKLDTPEALEKWMAERRKRFPTADKVADKQQKLNEAIERGQLPVDDPRSLRQKRRRLDDSGNYTPGGRGRGHGRGRGADRGWRGRGGLPGTNRSSETKLDLSLPPRPVTVEDQPTEANQESSDSSSDSDSDGAPEVLSSKIAPVLDTAGQDVGMDQPDEAPEPVKPLPQPRRKPPPRQPRRPPHNPFASRPSLLRNLLLPEIRMTVSNLSQAIHFLVENDFLDNVELKPGQASNKMIEVIEQSNSHEPPPMDSTSPSE